MKKLSVPEHITLRKEFFPGLSAKELRQVIAAVLPGLAATILFWTVNDQPVARLGAILGLLLYAFVCFAVFSVPDGGQSIYTFLMRWLRFRKKQKKFLYKQGKEVLYLEQQQKPKE